MTARRRGWLAAACVLAACNPMASIEITVAGDGTTSPDPGKHDYPEGSLIHVNARPVSGATFTGWTGVTTGTLNPVVVLVSGETTLTAHFSTGSSGGSSSGGSSSSGSSSGGSSSGSEGGGDRRSAVGRSPP